MTSNGERDDFRPEEWAVHGGSVVLTAASARTEEAMVKESGETGRRWYGTWLWRALTLLGLGLALVAFGEVRIVSAGARTIARRPDMRS